MRQGFSNSMLSLGDVGTVNGNWLESRQAETLLCGMTKHSPFRYFKTSPEIIRLTVMLEIPGGA
jgi:hypothetical protein